MAVKGTPSQKNGTRTPKGSRVGLTNGLTAPMREDVGGRHTTSFIPHGSAAVAALTRLTWANTPVYR